MATFITDSDGLSGLTLYNNAAARIIPREEPKEETKMATGPNVPTLEDAWTNPEYWNVQQIGGVPQQQVQQQTPPPQQQQQVVAATATQGNPLALPKDEATLKRMIQQEAQHTMVNTLGTLANINQQKTQTLDAMKRKFSETPGYAPWTGVFENNFNKMVNQGYDIETAKNMSIEHVREMNSLGVKPPDRPQGLIPSGNNRGTGIDQRYLRADESNDVTAHFTDEDKIKTREDWINRRNVAADYIKSGGMNGMSYQEMYPAAFNRGRTDLIIAKK